MQGFEVGGRCCPFFGEKGRCVPLLHRHGRNTHKNSPSSQRGKAATVEGECDKSSSSVDLPPIRSRRIPPAEEGAKREPERSASAIARARAKLKRDSASPSEAQAR